MIKKSNIIFSNLYGSADPFINEAIKRRLAGYQIVKKSRQDVIDEIKYLAFCGRGVLVYTGMKWDYAKRDK